MSNQLFLITQNAILKDNEGRVLILRHKKSGKWLLPGGNVKEGEQWRDALNREIMEETGIDKFVIEEILDVDSFIMDSAHYYVITFVCKAGDDRVGLSNEHDKYVWIRRHEETDNYEFWHQDIIKRIKLYFKK